MNIWLIVVECEYVRIFEYVSRFESSNTDLIIFILIDSFKWSHFFTGLIWLNVSLAKVKVGCIL